LSEKKYVNLEVEGARKENVEKGCEFALEKSYTVIAVNGELVL